MVDIKKYSNIDLYGLLGVVISATDSEVSQNLLSHRINIETF